MDLESNAYLIFQQAIPSAHAMSYEHPSGETSSRVTDRHARGSGHPEVLFSLEHAPAAGVVFRYELILSTMQQ